MKNIVKSPNKFLLSLAFILNIFLANAQSSICKLSEEDVNTFECLAQNPAINAMDNDIISKISNLVGIAPDFSFKNCPNIKNASAIINPLQNNDRYILFDNDYFAQLYNFNQYSAIFIVAHEFGHHLNGHTIPKNYSNYSELQERELEADYFAGYVMFHFGASENDIIKTISKFPEPSSTYSSHPKNHERINSALKGFSNEANKYKSILYKIKEQVTNEQNALFNDFLKQRYEEFDNILEEKDEHYLKLINDIREKNIETVIDDLIYEIDQFQITNNPKHLEVADYLLSKFDCNSAFINELSAYVNYKKGNFDKSLEFYKEKYLKTKNEDDLVFYLENLSNVELINSDDTEIIENISKQTNNPKVFLNIGIYYMKNEEDIKSKEALLSAYNLIKDKEETILKSDILFHYGRTLYDEQLKKEDLNMSFPKMLFLKAKHIIEKYPDDAYYRQYYNAILFHLGNTQHSDKDFLGAINTYNDLLNSNPSRIDYLYKVNASLGNMYIELEEYQKAIQYFTNSITVCDNNELMAIYYYSRGKSYISISSIELGLNDINKSCDLGLNNACDLSNEIEIILKNE